MEVMLVPQIFASTPSEPEDEEELFRLQLSVAKRADELARARAAARCAEVDRTTWLLAETEVLPGLSPAQ